MASIASPGDMVAIIYPDTVDLHEDARAFACPGLYRIVPAKDGGICRVRIPLGRLFAEQMRAIARAAETHGNGIIEFTNRANLQLRGMPVGSAPMLVAELAEAGLAPPDRWADDVRNVLINPSAGFDPEDVLDVRPIAKAVLDALSDDPSHAILSPKFSIQIDGGGSLSVADHPHDIWLLALTVDGYGPMFKIGLGGAIDFKERSRSVRYCVPADAIGILTTLVADFTENGVRHLGVSRMRDVLRLSDADEIWHLIEARLGKPLVRIETERELVHAVPTTKPPLGIVQCCDVDRIAVGAAPVLGRANPSQLDTIAAVAEKFATGEIRLTPWRSFLIPNVGRAQTEEVVTVLSGAGLITSAEHTMAHMTACAGLHGCASALSDVRRDAEIFAESGLARGQETHLSGCSKSCAIPGQADVTLVAVSDSRYDVFRSGAPSRFGVHVASDVDLTRARHLIVQSAS